ncbi:high-affinity nickel-transport protein-domain-containing protein [Leucosporidium creatinivorum]|uniref:Nickel/cobalt efflux system n=1 Tax=Leucosporidium creatinivorum TaxID=106004 RepID=A0A1Y2F181_9BASI|nr:high-affinity nickel-transport protein-domain-containing protein [Leucosporidium creatinivorum]
MESVPEQAASPSRLQLIARWRPTWRLTLFGRSLVLLLGELLANLIIWAAALSLFAPDPRTRGVLSLCLIAWTLGLRHGLDMDHIVAIDNVTRNLVANGQLPVTVGLFFSLGHSSIVVGATIAIIVATSAIEKIPDVGAVGGIIGVSVSASFLFILAIINSVVLYQSLRLQKRRRRAAEVQTTAEPEIVAAEEEELKSEKVVDEEKGEKEARKDEIVPGLPATTCLARIGRPIFRLIDAPWKMYPVGVLFGFGFDTASEITLLGVSALAGSGHSAIPNSQIIILPLLFTAGMTLVDSCDSIFMLHAYALPGQSSSDETSGKASWRRLKLFEKRPTEVDELADEKRARMLPEANQEKLLTVSVVLTVISITVAMLICITEFMGLALEKCGSCSDAADNDPGLSGRWWRFWAAVNDNSGYLGAGVVGIFLVVFGVWAVVHRVQKRRARQAEAVVAGEETRTGDKA